MLAFFSSEEMPGSIEQDLIDFANQPVVISATNISPSPSLQSVGNPPDGFVASCQDGTVQFAWDDNDNTDVHYRILCGTEPGVYETVYPAVGNTLEVERYMDDLPFVAGQRYYAAIESVAGTGRVSDRSQEIGFTIREPRETTSGVPPTLAARLIWASLHAWVKSFFTL